MKGAKRTAWFEGRAPAEATTSAGLMTNEDGLEFVKLVNSAGASSEVYLFGGVVTSYVDAEGTEFIAVRPDAKMDGSKPISGGLSHCWPQVNFTACSISILIPVVNFFHFTDMDFFNVGLL